jgi:cytochrome P450 family 103
MTGVSSATIPPAPAHGLPILMREALEADPHTVFRAYRAKHPLVAHENGSFLALRLADVDRLSRDPRLRATETFFAEMRGVRDGTLFDWFKYGMMTANDDVHRRRRSPFSRAFAVRAMSELRPVVRRAADELINGWSADGRAEFVEQFAAKLPAQIISDLLGLPRADIPLFTKLVYRVTRFFSLSATPDETPEIEAASRDLKDYVENLLEQRRRVPLGDFLSTFLAAADEAGELSPVEMVYQIVQLIIAGTDTTRVAMTMLTALLLEHPEQWAAICSGPDLIPAAVVEALRFEPSVASFSRVSSEAIEIADTVVPAGAFVTLSTMSAMRDERAYARPDAFDIHRTDQPRLHPIFGAGQHRCIGEALARVELEESLAVLTRRLPKLRLERAPKITGASSVRRVDAMVVSWAV